MGIGFLGILFKYMINFTGVPKEAAGGSVKGNRLLVLPQSLPLSLGAEIVSVRGYRLSISAIPDIDLVNTGEGTFPKIWARLRA